MISIDRLEEMAIEELQTELKNFKEQIKLQNNFIDSLLKATNNSEWLNKTILDDEVSEIIEKIGMDYIEFEEGKEINAELKAELTRANCQIADDEILQCDMREAIEELKAENEELKRQYKELGQCSNGLKEYFEKEKETLSNRFLKLSKTLTEIKEIAEHCMKQDICTTCNNSDRCHIEDEEIPTYDVCKLILQKISEVEDVRN